MQWGEEEIFGKRFGSRRRLFLGNAEISNSAGIIVLGMGTMKERTGGSLFAHATDR